MSIEEKLTIITKNQEKVYKSGLLTGASGGVANGEIISLTDVAPGAYDIDVKLSSKNLFKSINYTKGTLSATDGTITSNATVKAYCLTTDYIYLKSGAYILSNIVGANLRYIAFYDLNKGFKSATWTARAKTFNFTITEDCYVRIDIERDATVAIDNFDTFCDEYQFMLEKGTKATAYTPFVADVSTTTLNALGKNLFNNTSLIKQVSYIPTNNNPTGQESWRNGYEIPLPVGTYTIRAIPKVTFTDIYIYGCVVDQNNKFKTSVAPVANTTLKTITFNIENGDMLKIYDGVGSDSIAYSKDYFDKFDIQLEVGESATSYEPYIQPTSYKPMADGTVEDIEMIYPNMTLMSSIQGVLIDCEYRMDAKESYNKGANKGALSQCPKNTVGGEFISLDDVSPIEHNLGVKVSSKNIFNNVVVSEEKNGLTFTVNADKSVTVNGTAEVTTFVILGEQTFEPNTYYLSGCSGGSDSTYILFWQTPSGGNMKANFNGASVYNLAQTETRRVIIGVYKGTTVDNVTFYPMITTYSTTDYTPYVDVSTVTLNVLGKNWFNNDTSLIMDELQSYYGASSGAKYDRYGYAPLELPVGTYTLSANLIGEQTEESYLYWYVLNSNNVAVGSGRLVTGYAITSGTFTINSGEKFFICNGSGTDTLEKTKRHFGWFDIQLEVGESVTKYEPYIEPVTYTPNAGGTVEGVKSIYPNTTLMADKQGVLVECEYYQDPQKAWFEAGEKSEYDTFWDKLQNYGKPSAYGNLFSCTAWTDELYNPKYTIKALSANSMFGNSIITDTKVPIDLTENNGQVFYIFQDAKKLVTINKLILKNNQSLSRYFTNCIALKNLNIEGVISKDVDLQYSTLLTKASIENVVGCLSDTTGAKLILSETAVNNAFETSKGKADGSTSEDWINLITPKSNSYNGLWTITLV